MSRRFGMWIAIICILVVGVSVTKMTNDFVSSNGVEAAAIANVMDTSIPLTSGMGAVESIINSVEETVPEVTMEEAESADLGVMDIAEESMEEIAPASENSAIFEAYNPDVEAALPIEDYSVSSVPSASPQLESASVKSPLDPVVEKEGPFVEEKRVQEEMDSAYFLDRFALAEASSSAYWDMATPDHAGAYYTAAEQEHVLWDHELNQVYSTIRDRLPEDERDDLRVLEMEWIKERNLYANKSMSASKNKAMQSTDYLQALTQMTKDRCYWLVEEYRDVLDSKE